MRIASWNVNSVRARLEHVKRWLRETTPDVLCLQETKVVDREFPEETFKDLGYETARVGQPGYNGVAIVARHPIEEVVIGLSEPRPEDEARLIRATVCGVRVLSAYIPNGKNLDSSAYHEKLEWLERLRRTLDSEGTSERPLALCGDFNVARDDRDVFDAQRMRDQIHFSAPEHRAINHLLDFGLVDSFREVDETGGQFSWWDYRMSSFERNRGLRIDYVFITTALRERLDGAGIDRSPRTWEKPSDHAPVFIDVREAGPNT